MTNCAYLLELIDDVDVIEPAGRIVDEEKRAILKIPGPGMM
jgi:hypothetical protein